MAGHTTVKELVNNLMKEDQDSPIIYQYYLAGHFEASSEVFVKVANEFESLIPCLRDAHDVIADSVAEHSGKYVS